MPNKDFDVISTFNPSINQKFIFDAFANLGCWGAEVYYLITDVSEQSLRPIFKVQAVPTAWQVFPKRR